MRQLFHVVMQLPKTGGEFLQVGGQFIAIAARLAFSLPLALTFALTSLGAFSFMLTSLSAFTLTPALTFTTARLLAMLCNHSLRVIDQFM